jgi:hypothetical protein
MSINESLSTEVYENEFVSWIHLNTLVGTKDIIADKRYKQMLWDHITRHSYQCSLPAKP